MDPIRSLYRAAILLGTIAGLAAPALAAEDVPFGTRFACTGNEPSWGLQIDGTQATYDSILAATGTTLVGTLQTMADQNPATLVWRAQSGPGAEELVAVLTGGQCWDTMADAPPSPLSASVSIGPDLTVAGCCRIVGESWLARSSWSLTALNGTPVAAEQEPPTLTFGVDGTVNGFAGCNLFFGAVDLHGAQVSFGQLGASRRLCPQPEMDLEQQVFAAFDGVLGYRMDGRQLVLEGAGGAPLLTFESAAP